MMGSGYDCGEVALELDREGGGREKCVVLAVHGIGNQKVGDTAQKVSEALDLYRRSDPPAHRVKPVVMEFHWASRHTRPSPLRFMLWAVKMLPLLVFMTFQGDIRDGTSRPDRRLGVGVLVILPLSYGLVDFPNAILLTVLSLYFLVPGSWRRVITRIAVIVGPATLLGLIIDQEALLFLAVALIGLLIAVGQRNFIASVALVAESGGTIQEVEWRLARSIRRLVRKHGRLVIAAHSMGAYLVFRALAQIDASTPELLDGGKVQVIGIGSGVKPLTVLRTAARARSWMAYGWVNLVGVSLALTGAWFITLSFVGFGEEGRLNSDSTFERWFGSFLGYDNPAYPIYEWFEQLPVGRSLVLLFTPIGAGGALLVLGILVARFCQNSMKRGLQGSEELSVPGDGSWVDCCSVHDTVGRSKWPPIANLVPVPISGLALPMADHPLGRYLRSTSPVVRLVSTAIDDVRISPTALTAAGGEMLAVSNYLDRKRDVLVVATIAFLYASTRIGTAILEGLGVADPQFANRARLSVLGVVLVVGSVWRLVAGIRMAKRSGLSMRTKIALETLRLHGKGRRIAAHANDGLLGLAVMLAASFPLMAILYRLGLGFGGLGSLLAPMTPFLETISAVGIALGFTSIFAALMVWFTMLAGLRQHWFALVVSSALACASVIVAEVIHLHSMDTSIVVYAGRVWTVTFCLVIIILTISGLLLLRPPAATGTSA